MTPTQSMPPSGSTTTKPEACRVMIVDDSAVVRGIIARILEEDGGIRVVASAANGEIALNTLVRNKGNIDVILLDIEMPVMDGLTALPKLLQADPTVRIIMSSTLTVRNAEISLKALQLGAKDYIPKPSTSRDAISSVNFKHDLLEKVKTFGNRQQHSRGNFFHQVSAPSSLQSSGAIHTINPHGTKPASGFQLRPFRKFTPHAIAIGSSTGGPQALLDLLRGLGNGIRQPIFITQHMPPRFTTVLANHISMSSGKNAIEPKDGEIVREEHIYLAPGDYHMIIERSGSAEIIRLNKKPHENYCRPAVDPMFRSLSDVYGCELLGIVLTGMGCDGLDGGQKIVEAGGTLVAQNEESSIVWGMPGAVARAGLCSAVMSLGDIRKMLKTIGTNQVMQVI